VVAVSLDLTHVDDYNELFLDLRKTF
jgi:hypothetical protein